MGDYKKSVGFGGKKSGGFCDRNNRDDRPGYGGGRPSFGRRSGFGRREDRDGGPKEMFQAVCADCGKSCQVPFRPSGDKPVYCSDCFGAHRVPADDRRDRGRREDYGGRDRFPRGEYSPVSRREFVPSFASKAPMVMGDKRMDELKRQLDGISAKVDTIFRIVSGKMLIAKDSEKQPKKKVDEESVKVALKSIMVDAKKDGKKTIKKAEKKAVKKVEKKVTRKKTTVKKK